MHRATGSLLRVSNGKGGVTSESHSRRQQRKRFGQRESAPADRFGRSVFVRPVADSVAAGDENHRHRADSGHEKRIVVGAGYHPVVRKIERLAGGFNRLDDTRIASRRVVPVDEFFADGHAAAPGDPGAGGFERVQHFIAAGGVGVADIRLQMTRLGMLLTAPGKISQTPTVATCR